MTNSAYIAHVINPYQVRDDTERRIQKLTIESLVTARNDSGLEIEQLAVHFQDEELKMPQSMRKLGVLSRSFRELAGPEVKRLPFIADILDGGYRAANAEYLIYTNMDIIVQPQFYRFVAQKIQEGYDAIIINRRRLPSQFLQKELSEVYLEKGKSHPGFDCFVFRADLVPKMFFGQIVYAPFIGVTIAHNLFCYASNPLLLDNEHLTAHIGEEIFGKRDAAYWYNRREFFSHIKPRLWQDFDISKFPYSSLPIVSRYYKWVRNPSLFTFMNFKLELRKLLHGH